MPQICSVCRSPRRVEIEQSLIGSVPLRTIVEQFGPSGPSKTALLRHRSHIAGTVAQQTQARESKPTGTLLGDIRAGEGRAERLYGQAEEILASALQDKDRRTALQAIRTAIDVMGEARGYLELRGELTGELDRDRGGLQMSIQIVCPSAPSPELAPRISFSSIDAIESSEPVESASRKSEFCNFRELAARRQ
jgi:hypothetical protein